MSKHCILEIIDEVNVKFHNLDPGIRRTLVNNLKFEVPGARHMPAVRLGRWDGKKSFFTVGGGTYFNLLELIMPVIANAGYTMDLDDKRINSVPTFSEVDENIFDGKVWPTGHQLEGKPIVLRDYQVKAVNAYLQHNKCIQELATGAGKTIITAALSYSVEKQTGGRTIMIVPNKDLVNQTYNDYVNVGLDVGVYYGDRKDIGKQHTICTWQSLNILQQTEDVEGLNLFDAFLYGVNCVIVDEAHITKADVLLDLLTKRMNNIPIRWGLTGTVPEHEYQEIALLAAIGEVKNELSSKDLQDMGVLAECNINIVQTQERGQFKSYPEELKFLVSDPTRLKYIADSIRKISETGNTLVLVDRISAGTLLQEFLECHFISGEDKSNVRKENYDRINQGHNEIVIATFGIAAVGINIPRIFNLVMIEPGKSYIRVIQSIGRGIRKANDKDKVEIWDFTSVLKYSARHLSKRKQFYKLKSFPFSVTKVSY